MESDLHAVREESCVGSLSSQDPSPSVVLDVQRSILHEESGFLHRASFCKILCNFYEDEVDGQKVLEFGADVDNFYATSTYRVLKPVGEGLSTIASYLKPTGRPEETSIQLDPATLRDLSTIHQRNRGTTPTRVGMAFEPDQWQGELVGAEPAKCSELV